MEKVQLRCPVCGARLIDSVSGNRSELVPEWRFRTGWKPDYIQKCPKCKTQIGIRKLISNNSKVS